MADSIYNDSYNPGPAVTAGPFTPPKRMTTKKIVILVLSLFLAFILFFTLLVVGIVFTVRGALQAATETEEYAVAYEYLVNSHDFQRIATEDTVIRLNSYSTSTHSSGSHATQNATFGFTAEGYAFEVVLHKDNDVWYVCERCTDFE